MHKQKKQITLPFNAHPMRKLFEYFYVMHQQGVDYYDVDLDQLNSDYKPNLTNKTGDFIKRRAKSDLVTPQRKLFLGLVESNHNLKKFDLTQPLHSIRILDMGTLTWLRNRIEIMSMIGLPATSIYTEIKRLTGEELYSLEEVRSYIYFFLEF